MNVTMNTSELIDIVSKNMNSHITEFNTAFKAYTTKLLVAVENLRRNIIEEKAFTFDDLFNLPRPTSYEHEYKNILHLLKNHKSTTIDLNTTDYKQFVLDEWNWSRGFKGTTSSYNIR